jgi:hypothetical protein
MPMRVLVVVGVSFVLLAAAPTDMDRAYKPVAPPAALSEVLRSELKTLQGWLDDRDFASSAGTVQGLTTLSHLYSYQGSTPSWREKTAALSSICSQLQAATRKKDAALSARLAKECGELLDSLTKLTPGDPEKKDYRPQGSLRTWMLLLDAAHSDAKTAKTAQQLELLAGALAEEANAYQRARSDERWQKWFSDVRSNSLSAVEKARAKDLAGAKASLKAAYQHCEACHDSRKR